MIGLDKAQRAYDRQEPTEQARPEFSERDIEALIAELAGCGAEPAKWIESECDGESLPDDVAELLQAMALSCHAGYTPEMPGSGSFWRVMKRLAIERFEAQGGVA